MNKKGVLGILVNPIFWIVLVLFFALFFVIPRVTAGGVIDSQIPVKDGCEPVNLEVRIKGQALVYDQEWMGVRAEAKDIEISSIKSSTTGQRILSFSDFNEELAWFKGNQNYNWKMELVNTKLDSIEDTDTGSNVHPGDDKVIQENDFVLDFGVPDNNCDMKIDDFDVRLNLEVKTEDGEITILTKTVTYEEGKHNIR